MLLEAATLVILGSRYAYHRWQESKRPLGLGATPLDLPRTQEGDALPLLFGRYIVRNPIIAWAGNAEVQPDPIRTAEGFYFYEVAMLYAVAIPVENGVNRLQGIYIGDQRYTNLGTPSDMPPNLGVVTMPSVAGPSPSTLPDFSRLGYEWGDGADTQNFAASEAASQMVTAGIPAGSIPEFRGLITFYGFWSRNNSTIPALGLEFSSYPFDQRYHAYIPTRVGDEMNPADVIASVLCDRFGKLGLDPSSVIDQQSFQKAGEALLAEGCGYSMCWSERTPARDIINDVLRVADGVLFKHRTTGRWKLKLIRADYDPNALKVIDQTNALLENVEITGWSDVPNRVRVKWRDRQDGYREKSSAAQNQAGAVNELGETDELVLDFPAICTKEQAEATVARELGARSMPLLRCRAVVNRDLLDVELGEAVKLHWPAYGISNRVMRVADIQLGGPTSNSVTVALLEDSFYVHRKYVSPLPPVAPFPTTAEVG